VTTPAARVSLFEHPGSDVRTLFTETAGRTPTPNFTTHVNTLEGTRDAFCREVIRALGTGGRYPELAGGDMLSSMQWGALASVVSPPPPHILPRTSAMSSPNAPFRCCPRWCRCPTTPAGG
jgi:hypothetical protein